MDFGSGRKNQGYQTGLLERRHLRNDRRYTQKEISNKNKRYMKRMKKAVNRPQSLKKRPSQN